MKKKRLRHRKDVSQPLTPAVVLLLVMFFFTLLLPTPITAITSGSTVTATVPNSDSPTTPILISPSNNSYVTTTLPSFVWKKSTDANGIGKYQLFVDGAVLYDNIPTTATSNSNYTLTYNATTERYTLTTKNPVAQGNHTWKIKAFDTLGNTTDSATWNFTVDNQAPTFVLNNLGEAAVSISAQDPGTVPTSPIELDDNEPLIQASGEASSQVQLTVTIPGDPTQNVTSNISTGGAYLHQLGILPRDVVMTLSFVITDQAGNVSVLNGVEFIINSPVIVFPPVSPSPSPTPTPSPVPTPSPSVTPTPGVTPEPEPTPTPSPSPSPTLPVLPTPPATPIVSIPVLPPREIANEIVQETLELFSGVIPEAVQETAETVTKTVAPVSVAVVASAAPTFSLVAVASQFGSNLSANLIIKILQALGLLPAGKPQGLVFNSQTYEPVPFALLTITNTENSSVSLTETVVTDVHGVYRGIKLPMDEFKITVSHQDFTFPSKAPRSPYTPLNDFYKGESFRVSSEKQSQLFLIPVDPVTKADTVKKWRPHIRLSSIGKVTQKAYLPLFIFSGVLAIIFPTIWNMGVFAIYALNTARKAKDWFRVPRITGTIIDNQGNPLENVVVRISEPETAELTAVLTTDQNGNFAAFVKPKIFQVSISKPDYVWNPEGSSLSLYQVDVTEETTSITLTMQPLSTVYDDLFADPE